MMKLKLLVFLCCVFAWGVVYAQNLETSETPNVETSQKLVIITHPCGKSLRGESIFDYEEVAKTGVNNLVRFSNNQNIPAVVLNGCGTYVSDKWQTLKYSSDHGELSFIFSAQEVYLAGGYFEWCFDKTFNDILWQFSKNVQNSLSPQVFNVYLISDGIYQQEFIPEKPWVPTSSLLKNALGGWINNEEALRYWATGWIQLRAFYSGVPNFEINIDVYGQPTFYRAATGATTHRLNIHFIDSTQLGN